MAEMSVIWLRVAAALYSLGLLHAILTLVRRREHLFRVALGAFGLGSVFHFVSIIEEGIGGVARGTRPGEDPAAELRHSERR